MLTYLNAPDQQPAKASVVIDVLTVADTVKYFKCRRDVFSFSRRFCMSCHAKDQMIFFLCADM